MPSRARISLVVLLALALAGSAVALSAKRITGTARADVLRGTDDSDVIRGRAGNDTLHGRGGSDRLEGGPGHDSLFGDAGDDSLFAGGGPISGTHVEKLQGGAGNDLLVSGPGGGSVELFGGPGNDVLRGSSGTRHWSADSFSAGPGDDKILAVDSRRGDGFYVNACGSGYDVVEFLRSTPSPLTEKTMLEQHGCEKVIFR